MLACIPPCIVTVYVSCTQYCFQDLIIHLSKIDDISYQPVFNAAVGPVGIAPLCLVGLQENDNDGATTW